MAEQPIRHRLRDCEGCGESFVDSDGSTLFCTACQAAASISSANAFESSGPAAPAGVLPSAPVGDSSPLRIREEAEDGSSIGLPGKTAWSTPPFQVGWDDYTYPGSSGELPAARSLGRGRRRVLLALIAVVSVLLLISRLDAPSVELVWRDWTRGKAANERPPMPVSTDVRPGKTAPPRSTPPAEEDKHL